MTVEAVRKHQSHEDGPRLTQLKPTHTPTNPDSSVSPILATLTHPGIGFWFPEVWAKRNANNKITD